ncbi:hypothetical protein [Curtobacterium sp. MCBD17_030]|uniref:WD40/YVTN/BNR-like repeat-containing protein n=1 Tax=Curtobacterium sp. MCBD17_030 TaxID=2175649 RepID=UPI000D8736F4|nr:hypothetical protein [Curtobacterium sp. MCBD17_030]PYY31833.1 hypothetical protein DEI89_15300 [Curtobacterium sp. MCBD17_030]
MIWVAIVIVVLVVIDIALVTLALGRTAPNSGDPAGPIPTFSSSPRSSTSSPTPTADAAGARRSLSAVDGQEAWRATDGTCGGPAPTLEHTLDAGATWKPVTLGTDVSSLMAIRASSANLTVLAGVGDDCTTTVRTSTDDGVTWTAGSPGAAGAGVSTAGIVFATGVVEPPCSEPIEAYQGKSTSVVICDGQLEWRGGAGEWVDVPLSGVRSVADAGMTYTLARINTELCDGVQIESLPAVDVTPETSTTPIGCDADVATSEPLSLDRVDDHVWLWAGDTVSVSADGGATW